MSSKQFHDQGITVILVEQSVNVALTACDKAFFMEKGAVRFHGLTSELIDRPDLLRSIFLDGVGRCEGESAGRGRRGVGHQPSSLAGWQRQHPERTRARGAGRATWCSRRSTSRRRFAGRTAVDGVSITAPRGRDRRHRRSERRRQDDVVRPDLGLHRPRLRRGHPRWSPDSLDAATTTRQVRAARGPSRTPGSSAR